MTIFESNGIPPSLAGEDSGNICLQYGALCYRIVGGKPQILLITSRTRGRWIIPKGWPIKGKSPIDVARIEAWEEGGVRGKATSMPLGRFGYIKRGDTLGPDLPCIVEVYPVLVKSLIKDFPERKQRKRKWFSQKAAAAKIADPELRKILKRFDPFKLP